MKFTILGSGSCYGVPTIGNDWGACSSDNPKNNRTAPSLLIETETTKILIDMGPDYRQQSVRHMVTDLDAVIFTHAHADHILGVFHLPKMMKYMKKDLPLYATKETQAGIERSFWYLFDADLKIKYDGKSRHFWQDIVLGNPFTIGDITLNPLLQHHGSMDSLGLRIGDFAYCTDFCEWPDKTWKELEALDVLVIECNAKNRVTEPEEKHMYLEKTLEYIAKLAPKRAILTHLGTSMDYDSINQVLPHGVELAYDGLVIAI